MMWFFLEVETVELIASLTPDKESETNFSEIRFTTASAEFQKAFLIDEEYAFGGDAGLFMHKERLKVKFIVTIQAADYEGTVSEGESLGEIEFLDYMGSEPMLHASIRISARKFAAFCEAVQRECRINIGLRNEDIYFQSLNSYSDEELWIRKEKRQKLPITDFFMKIGSHKNFHRAGAPENPSSGLQITANVERRLKRVNEQNLWILGVLVIVACALIGQLKF